MNKWKESRNFAPQKTDNINYFTQYSDEYHIRKNH